MNLNSKQNIAFDYVLGVFFLKSVYLFKKKMCFVLFFWKNVTKSYRKEGKQCWISPEGREMYGEFQKVV